MNFGEWLSTRPWTFWVPAPAVMVHAWVLSRSSLVWSDVMHGSTRSGRATETIAAHFHLGLLGFALLFYVVLGVSDGEGFRGRFYMRAPTDSERMIALGIARGLAAIAMYVGAWILWRKYG